MRNIIFTLHKVKSRKPGLRQVFAKGFPGSSNDCTDKKAATPHPAFELSFDLQTNFNIKENIRKCKNQKGFNLIREKVI